ncbi:MAG: transposase [Bacteroidales bacterium]|nr:transposase [Bacteroidales bacterium]
MSIKKRRVVPEAVHHIYQRTKKGFLIFYSVKDCLVYFTLFSTLARRQGVQVLGLCLMPDHIHIMIKPASSRQLSLFIKDVTGQFVKAFNQASGKTGSLFDSQFGSAPKTKAKKVRENIAYLYNNPVEKELSSKAEEYRWNFLAYAGCRNPFSEKIRLRLASQKMRRAVREVNDCARKNQALGYKRLDRLFDTLDKKEKVQLLDHIISTYNAIDYPATIGFYGSHQKMLTAIHSNTGSEHDLREVWDAQSDRVYAKMSRIVEKEGDFRNISGITALPVEEKLAWFRRIQRETAASPRQIAKFLHMEMREEYRGT